MNKVDGLLFAKTHEWIKQGDDQSFWVGISNHAQEALGDVMFVQLPALELVVKQGDACASIESLKAASDIHAPISGKIIAINSVAQDSPEAINGQPYDVWLFKIQPEHPDSAKAELDSLLSPSAYDNSLED
jgi:glycine cleavage system H protein